MGFASDNPGSPGIVGSSSSHMHDGYLNIAPGNEVARDSLEALAIRPEVGHSGLFQMALPLRGWLARISQRAVNFQHGAPGGFFPDTQPEQVRPSVTQDRYERPARTGNYGSVRDLENDPEGRNITAEAARQSGQFSEPWDISTADALDPSPILHVPEYGLTDDITQLVQTEFGEAHDALRSVRHNFPFLPIAQFPPQSVSINLLAGTASEIVLPDLTVACRISWTQKASNDLFVSLHGNARIPLIGDLGGGNMSESANKGMLLNPDDTKYFYVKDIKSFSAICANNCIVNVQCYLNN
jgi:hypothetical protein